MKNFKEYLKLVLPSYVLYAFRKIKYFFREIEIKLLMKRVRFGHKIALKKIKQKQKISISFFLLNVDTWKYDSLYKKFSNSNRFEVFVVICPFISNGDSFKQKEIEKSVNYCKSRGYKYIIGDENSAVDIKEKADIFFFSNPNNHTIKYFLIENYWDKLTCYIFYSFRVSNYYSYEYNTIMQNLVWINFLESSVHKDLTEKFSRNSGTNLYVSGYPHLENFSPILSTEKPKKTIIWAPHWTIKNYQETGLDWSCFLDYNTFFLQIADEYIDQIEIVLKPHPLLKTILEDKVWGKFKTDIFFETWEKKENCKLVEGDYVTLFDTSDALIHDSGGFLVEYLVQNKPVAFTVKSSEYIKNYNEFGRLALQCHEIIRCEKDLRNFINSIISGDDTQKKQREVFLKQDLNVLDKKPSELIFDEIIRKIDSF